MVGGLTSQCVSPVSCLFLLDTSLLLFLLRTESSGITSSRVGLSCRIGHFGEKKKNCRGLAQSLSLVLLMSGVLLMSELLQKSELLLMSKVLLMSVFVLCVESTQKCL